MRFTWQRESACRALARLLRNPNNATISLTVARTQEGNTQKKHENNTKSMPGRHGKQRVVRKRNKKAPRNSPMDMLVTDSFFNRQRKEREILSDLVPVQRIEVKRALGGGGGGGGARRGGGGSDATAVVQSSAAAVAAAAAAPVTKKMTVREQLREEDWHKLPRKRKNAGKSEQDAASGGAAVARVDVARSNAEALLARLLPQ